LKINDEAEEKQKRRKEISSFFRLSKSM